MRGVSAGVSWFLTILLLTFVLVLFVNIILRMFKQRDGSAGRDLMVRHPSALLMFLQSMWSSCLVSGVCVALPRGSAGDAEDRVQLLTDDLPAVQLQRELAAVCRRCALPLCHSWIPVLCWVFLVATVTCRFSTAVVSLPVVPCALPLQASSPPAARPAACRSPGRSSTARCGGRSARPSFWCL
jgi:hypothetical protein